MDELVGLGGWVGGWVGVAIIEPLHHKMSWLYHAMYMYSANKAHL